MSEVAQLVAALGLVLISVLTRSFFFMTDRAWPFPRWFELGLRYAPIGALAATAVPTVVLEHGQLPSQLWEPRIWAAVAALTFAMWRKDMLLTILLGMGVYHAMRWWH